MWGGGGGVCADTTQYYIRALGIGRFPRGELSRIPKDNCAIFLPDGLESGVRGQGWDRQRGVQDELSETDS